jgi:glycosyltransferase involved in cell wall biosynthesis
MASSQTFAAEVRPMRVLVVAFSCAPNRGSESKVAWNWVKSLAANSHELIVLTTPRDRDLITAAAAQSADLKRISFRYLGNVKRESLAHKWRFVLQLYYIYWQWGARRAALRIAREKPLDVVHAITLGGVRFPAFLGGIAQQFVLGPIGGGQTAPVRLTDAMGLRIAFIERLRHAANWINRLDPFMRVTFKAADAILVTSLESAMAVPRRYRAKCVVRRQVGVDEREIAPNPLTREIAVKRPFRILYAGRYLHWKGMEFGIRAFAELIKSFPDATLSLTGGGPAERRWKAVAVEIGVADRITWLGWGKHEDIPRVYRDHHVLLFPTLREPAGMAVAEAFAAGLPVICFQRGGEVLVDDRVGRMVDVSAANYDETVDRLGAALRSVAQLDADAYRQLSANALGRAHAIVWNKVVDGVYGPLYARTAMRSPHGYLLDALAGASDRGGREVDGARLRNDACCLDCTETGSDS